jgi:hypothetical protein
MRAPIVYDCCDVEYGSIVMVTHSIVDFPFHYTADTMHVQ